MPPKNGAYLQRENLEAIDIEFDEDDTPLLIQTPTPFNSRGYRLTGTLFTIDFCCLLQFCCILMFFACSFLWAMGFYQAQLSISSTTGIPGTKFDETWWFVQISDVHISSVDAVHQWRARSLSQFIDNVAPVIDPDFVLLTGDLTDSRTGLEGMRTRQWPADWMTYASMVGRQDPLYWIDMRGNHDTYGVDDFTASNNYFCSYSLASTLPGRCEGFVKYHGQYTKLWRKSTRGTLEMNPVDADTSYEVKNRLIDMTFTPDKGSPVRLVGVDAALAPGFVFPFNYFGFLPKDLADSFESMLASTPPETTLLSFAHYPLNFMTSDGTKLSSVMSKYGVDAHLCGHIHPDHIYGRIGGTPNMQLACWKEHNMMRIVAFDHDLMSFTDVPMDTVYDATGVSDFDGLIVHILNPPSASFMSHRDRPLGNIRASSHVRVMIIGLLEPVQVTLTIDGTDTPMTLSDRNGTSMLYTVSWSPETMSGIHHLKVEALAANGVKYTNAEYFSTDGTQASLRADPLHGEATHTVGDGWHTSRHSVELSGVNYAEMLFQYAATMPVSVALTAPLIFAFMFICTGLVIPKAAVACLFLAPRVQPPTRVLSIPFQLWALLSASQASKRILTAPLQPPGDPLFQQYYPTIWDAVKVDTVGAEAREAYFIALSSAVELDFDDLDVRPLPRPYLRPVQQALIKSRVFGRVVQGGVCFLARRHDLPMHVALVMLLMLVGPLVIGPVVGDMWGVAFTFGIVTRRGYTPTYFAALVSALLIFSNFFALTNFLCATSRAVIARAPTAAITTSGPRVSNPLGPGRLLPLLVVQFYGACLILTWAGTALLMIAEWNWLTFAISPAGLLLIAYEMLVVIGRLTRNRGGLWRPWVALPGKVKRRISGRNGPEYF
ncbi:Calcineurin-like phosphoesterase [Carpediemonas membranifera]|uniref:Calcineurin-like phosphoesterase n=1 Tax=Carpediemonas membranifera TaxID=201153 RepID=A0A8J6B8Z5_9EUKA|nr:Calcineurin-like phosphoesterase [Carpediemonas membranifera]|eukprot:KAG9392472.1 Calcineurin-like phosphoesterase [Carpediemonas membranifera]